MACANTAAGAVISVVAEVVTLHFKVLGLPVDSLIPSWGDWTGKRFRYHEF